MGHKIRLIELNSHLLPNIYDYNKTIETSLKMVDMYIKDNVKDVIVTATVGSETGFNDRKNIRSNFNYLNKQIDSTKLNLYLGYQVLIDKNFQHDYSEFTLGKSKYILIELGSDLEVDVEEVVLDLLKKGLIPIISSVEKYQHLNLTFNVLKRIKTSGGLIAVNANAVIGERGKTDQKHIQRLLDDKLIDFVASNSTDDTTRLPLLRQTYDYLLDKIDINYLNNILYNNQNKILKQIRSLN